MSTANLLETFSVTVTFLSIRSCFKFILYIRLCLNPAAVILVSLVSVALFVEYY